MISVFIEIIELNVCGLNYNLKKNIINRSSYELYSIYDNEIKSDEDNNSDGMIQISSGNKEDEDNNSEY